MLRIFEFITWVERMSMRIIFQLGIIILFAVIPNAAFSSDQGPGEIVYSPVGLEEHHLELEKIFSVQTIEKMRKGSEKEMEKYHSGLGLWLRNNWGKWEESELSTFFREEGILHPEDIAGIILDTFWCKLNDQPHRIDERIGAYQNYFKSLEAPTRKSPTDGSRIKWVITQVRDARTVHLGISESDKSFWRYEYGNGNSVYPAGAAEKEDLKQLIERWKELGTYQIFFPE